MKLIKYFFTIPFSQKGEWKKAHKLIENSKNIKEHAIVVFLLMSLLQIGYLYFYSLRSEYFTFSFELALFEYFKSLFVIFLSMLVIKMIGTALKFKEIPLGEIFVIVVLGSGLISLLSNFVFLFYEDVLMYSLFGPAFLNYIFLMIAAFFVIKGLIPYYGESFKWKKLTKNIPSVIIFALVIFGINFIYVTLF